MNDSEKNLEYVTVQLKISQLSSVFWNVIKNAGAGLVKKWV